MPTILFSRFIDKATEFMGYFYLNAPKGAYNAQLRHDFVWEWESTKEKHELSRKKYCEEKAEKEITGKKSQNERKREKKSQNVIWEEK